MEDKISEEKETWSSSEVHWRSSDSNLTEDRRVNKLVLLFLQFNNTTWITTSRLTKLYSWVCLLSVKSILVPKNPSTTTYLIGLDFSWPDFLKWTWFWTDSVLGWSIFWILVSQLFIWFSNGHPICFLELTIGKHIFWNIFCILKADRKFTPVWDLPFGDFADINDHDLVIKMIFCTWKLSHYVPFTRSCENYWVTFGFDFLRLFNDFLKLSQ